MDEKRSEGARAPTADFLEFLDEERRRDKALLAELEQSLENQAAQLSELVSRQVAFEDQLLRLQNQFTHLPSAEETVERVEQEVEQLLEKWREERSLREAEVQALRAREMAAQTKAVQEIRGETLSEMKRLFQAQKSEVERLSQLLVDLRQEVSRWLDKDKEQERRIDYLEGWAKQSVKKIGELELTEEKKAKANSQFLEKLRSQEEERRKQTDLLREEITSFEETVAVVKRQRAIWEKQNQELSKHIEEIRKLSEGLRTRQGEWEAVFKVERGRDQKEWEEWRKKVEKVVAKSRGIQERQVMEEAKRQKEWVALWQAQTEYLRRQVKETEEWVKGLEKQLKLLSAGGQEKA